jgi:PHD/YefM family antitoxin component YafN of YafNO toxin-antitoxin module
MGSIDLRQIHPVSDFVRNYKSFLSRIKATGNPEILTVNGKPEYVILDAESYQSIATELERARFIKAVNEGIEDMRAGRGKPVAEAFSEIRSTVDL